VDLLHALTAALRAISPLEATATITGALCVWLLVKQNIWTWPTGIVSCFLFIFVFRQSKLYGDMALQFFFIAMSLYGWWNWLHGGKDDSELKVSHTSGLHGTVLTILTAAFTAIAAMQLHQRTDSTTPIPDALTTALSVTAQYMQTKKLVESWYVWITADVIYIGLYIYKHLYLTSLLYAIFMAMCVAGLLEWRAAYKKEHAEAVTA